MDGYIPLKAYAKYNLVKGLYATADVGTRIGFNGNKTQFVAGLALGYEHNFTEKVAGFAELGVDAIFANAVQFVPSVTIGAKVTF